MVEVIGHLRYPKVKRVWKGVCGVKRVAGAVLAGLGVVMLAFCVCFAVFELLPAYVKMRQTGDGAGFGLGVMMLLWWFLPTSAVLLVGGVLLRRPAGSIPAVPARSLAVVTWAGAAALLLWVVSRVIGGLSGARQWYGCGGAELLRLAVQDLVLGLPVLVLALLLGWSSMRLWRGVWALRWLAHLGTAKQQYRGRQGLCAKERRPGSTVLPDERVAKARDLLCRLFSGERRGSL